MEQGDGYRDEEADVCPCAQSDPGVFRMCPKGDLLTRQARAIEELVSIAGYLPEANAILAKYGLL